MREPGIRNPGILPLRTMAGWASLAPCYFLRVPFDAANQGYANGQVVDVPPEGILDGQLTIVETIDTIALAANRCAYTRAALGFNQLGFFSTGLTKALGLTLLLTLEVDDWDDNCWAGFHDIASIINTALEIAIGAMSAGDDDFRIHTAGGVALPMFTGVDDQDYRVAIVLGGYDSNGIPWRAGQSGTSYLYGAAFFVEVAGAWTLLWREIANNTSPLYPVFQSYNASGTLDNFRVPCDLLVSTLQPIALSTFDAANGTSLDAIMPEVGGAWTERTGNFDIQTNRANISVSTGVRDVSTIAAGDADVFARTIIRKTVAADSGEFGHCLRYSDDNNFWMVQGDLANNRVEIIERNGGVETSRAFAAIALTHSTDYDLVAIADGQDITAFLDGGNMATYGLAALNENATIHGVVGNQVGQTFDAYHLYPRRSGVYNALLNAT